MSRSVANPNALVLPPEAAHTSEAQHFPGFPGEWRPGNPVKLATLGLDLMSARALIDELGLPLVEVDHRKREEPAVPDANPPRLDGNTPFGDALAPAEAPAEAPEAPAVPDAPAETPGGAE